tara:strand:- start:8199 stop:8852 length:654 start_codon:yes stop_codon:yes gene_type:complete
MCAIFGSKDPVFFKELYNQNTSRGSAAHGMVFLKKNDASIIKGSKIFCGLDSLVENKSEFIYFTGHTQAPTSAAQSYDEQTSHPFICGDWVVSHNGVITNFKELSAEVSPESINIVDSSIIPALLCKGSESVILSANIVNVLSKIKGTHSTTIYNTRWNKLYIARCGSTLHIDDKGNYSSTPFKNSISVPDGSLLEYTDNKFKPINEFINNSPFFII